jgi:hypothetical protein
MKGEILGPLRRGIASLDEAPIWQMADFAFSIPSPGAEVTYELPDGVVNMEFRGVAGLNEIKRSGEIVSINDLDDAVMIVIPTQYFGDDALNSRKNIYLESLFFSISGRSFYFYGASIERFSAADGNPIFVIERFGDGR